MYESEEVKQMNANNQGIEAAIHELALASQAAEPRDQALESGNQAAEAYQDGADRPDPQALAWEKCISMIWDQLISNGFFYAPINYERDGNGQIDPQQFHYLGVSAGDRNYFCVYTNIEEARKDKEGSEAIVMVSMRDVMLDIQEMQGIDGLILNIHSENLMLPGDLLEYLLKTSESWSISDVKALETAQGRAYGTVAPYGFLVFEEGGEEPDRHYLSPGDAAYALAGEADGDLWKPAVLDDEAWAEIGPGRWRDEEEHRAL